MPCGGLYPVRASTDPVDWCLGCGKYSNVEHPLDHFVEEWDGYVSGKCAKQYLETDEGKIVLSHGHFVQIYDVNVQTERT